MRDVDSVVEMDELRLKFARLIEKIRQKLLLVQQAVLFKHLINVRNAWRHGPAATAGGPLKQSSLQLNACDRTPTNRVKHEYEDQYVYRQCET